MWELVVTSCPSSHAVQLVAHYSQAVGKGGCTVSTLSSRAQTAIGIEQKLPILVTGDGDVIRGTLAIVDAILTSLVDAPTAAIIRGETAIQKAAVEHWIFFAMERKFQCNDASGLHTLNAHLLSRTFLCGCAVSVADIIMYSAMHTWMIKASDKEKTANCNVIRWFDHIQHLPGIHGVVSELEVVQVKVTDIPVVPESMSSDAKPTKGNQSGQSPKQSTKEQKRKQEKSEKQPKKPQPAKEAERAVCDPTRLEIRVGVVTKVWEHAEAEKLFCEEIDIGEAEPRSIASGLRPFMGADGLLNQKVCVLANLKARNLKGFSSHGMILCATSLDGEKCELIRPPANTPIGELVTVEGLTGGPPDLVLPAKTNKNPFIEVAPKWKTGEDKVAYYEDKKWMTTAGACCCDSLVGATIS